MLFSVLFLPLIAVLYLTFFNKLGRDIKFITIMLLTLSLYEVIQTVAANWTLIILGSWVKIYLLQILWEFALTPFVCSGGSLVLMLSVLIQLYSTDYMNYDLNIVLFNLYLSLFTFTMLIILYSNNLMILLVGWEGVGLLSYLLINFWTIRVEANKSSLKAIFINKIGDIMLLLGSFWLFNLTLSFNISMSNVLTLYFKHELISFIAQLSVIDVTVTCLVIGGATKSAQFVFNLWLPDAMEGPTPVSSLIHSATMVAAGLILYIKIHLVISNAPLILTLILCLGFITSTLSSLESLCLFDHKSVLAGSTCDQLGLMFLIYGLGLIDLSFFQFCTHAFYKSLLFLSLGAIIHQSNEQDSRLLSVSYKSAPLILVSFEIGLVSLMGLPGSISHYSKSLIFNSIYTNNYGFSNSFWFILQSTQLVTNFNTLIGAFGIYCIQDSLPARKKQLINKSLIYNSYIKIPLIILSFLTLISGFLLSNINKYYLFNDFTGFTSNNFDIDSYFIASYILFINFILLLFLLILTYVYIEYTGIQLTNFTLLNYLSLNLYIDKSFINIGLNVAYYAYDIGYICINNFCFNLNYYLKYLLFYTYHFNKLHYSLNPLWSLNIYTIFLVIFLGLLF